MNNFLVAWALVLVAACFVITAVVVAVEIREHRRPKVVRPVPAPQRVPAQRAPSSAAAIVPVHDAAAFEEFLRELIVTTHVEDALR